MTEIRRLEFLRLISPTKAFNLFFSSPETKLSMWTIDLLRNGLTSISMFLPQLVFVASTNSSRILTVVAASSPVAVFFHAISAKKQKSKNGKRTKQSNPKWLLNSISIAHSYSEALAIAFYYKACKPGRSVHVASYFFNLAIRRCQSLIRECAAGNS